MKLKKFCRQALAVTLSVSLALGGGNLNVVGPQKAEAEEAVILPDPIYENTFEADDAAKGTKGEIVGEGKIEDSGDSSHGKVFHNAAGGRRKNYYLLPEDVFSANKDKIAENEGITISFALNAAEATDYYWSPIFSAYAGSPADNKNTLPMFLMLGRMILQYNVGVYGWSDFVEEENVKGTNEIGTQYTDDKQWHVVTAVISKSKGYFYVDGEIKNEWTTKSVKESSPDNTGFLNGGIEQLKYVCLGGNQAWENPDNDPAFMFDNVKIYPTALTEDQVKKLNSFTKISSITVNPSETELTNKYIYLSEQDQTEGKIAESDLAEMQFTAEISPKDAWSQVVDWSIKEGDKGKATIDATGKLQLTDKVKEGDTVTVYAKAADGSNMQGECTITVHVQKKISKNVQSIEIADQTLYMGYDGSGAMTAGQSLTPEIKITPDDADIKDVTFETDSDVIRIEGNKITALKTGTATVTATPVSNEGAKITFNVTVKDYEFGKPTSDFAEEKDAWGSAGSVYEKVTGNFNITYSFDNKSQGEKYYQNYLFELNDGAGKSRIYRADRWVFEVGDPGWGEVENKDSLWTSIDLNAYMAALKNGASVTVNAVRSDNDLIVTYKVKEKEGEKKEYTLTATSTAVNNLPDTLYMRITGQKCECTNVKITSAVTIPKQAEVKTNGTTEIALNDVIPSDVTIASAESDSDSATVKVAEDKKKVIVTGVKAGTAVIKVTASNNMKVDCKVTVSDVTVTGIELSQTALTLEKGKSEAITATVKPAEATNKTVTWDTENKAVATVDNGTITAVGGGKTKITATCGNVKAECNVTVIVPLKGIKFEKEDLALTNVEKDGTIIYGEGQLSVVCEPEDTTDEKTVTYQLSEEGVVSVDNAGKVTAKAKEGSVKITATSTANPKLKAECNVTVTTTNTVIEVTDIIVNPTTAEIGIGETVQLKETIQPEAATIKTVKWTTSDDTVADVDGTGLVTGIGEGNATITATTTDGTDRKAECSVTVKKPEDDVITLTEESQLGQYTDSEPYSRVSVHDPSIVVGYYEGTYSSSTKVYGTQNEAKTRKEIYFVFGSHMAWAYSLDLMNWTEFKNNINDDYAAIFKEDAAWSARGGSDYDISGNLWAPDVIWNPAMNKWCMYMSVNGKNWYTSIVLLTSDSLNGDWTRVGPVVYSGFTNKEEADATDLFKVIGSTEGTETVPARYLQRRNNNATYNMNAIDPCVVYDEEGTLWMTYGSWFGGIYMLKLDLKTGLRDYSHAYDTVVNVSDAYQGLKLAGGDHRSGEASYLEKIDGRWYLFLSYGALEAKGGYNMRMFSSDKITGPYKDLSGEDARYGGKLSEGEENQVLSANAGDCAKTTGSQLMNYYRWDFMNKGFAAEGHNSAFVDDDGKAYVIYHTRFDDGTEGHQVRVHQLFTAKNGGLVAAPFEYAGETLSTEAYDASEVAGEYTVILQKPTNYASLECRTTEKLELKEDGSVTGAYTGTWEQAADGPYVTMKLGNDTYQGVFLKQKMEEQGDSAVCFTLAGGNDLALWGYKLDSTVAIRKTLDQSIHIPSVTATDLTLPSEGINGCQITWKSNGIALTDDGKVVYLKEDSDVVLTATISNGKYRFIKDYKVKVLGSDSLSKEQEIEIAALYTDSELDISKMSEDNHVTLKNPLYQAADLSHGAVISFDIKRTADSKSLANIFTLNPSGGAGAYPLLYFCGAGYLGYNGPGGYYDANLGPEYTQADDLFTTGEYVNIKIKLTPDGFEVYKDGTLAYSRETLAAGTTKGNINVGNWSDLGSQLLNWLANSAEELNFGYGNWWPDLVFQGTLKNMKFSYIQPAVDVSGSSSGSGLLGLYTQDYEDVADIGKEWTSPSASECLILGKDEVHGNYMKYDLTLAEKQSGGRGAYFYFDDSVLEKWPDSYQLEYDMALTSGSDGKADQSSQVAVVTSKTVNNKNANNGIESGYVMHLKTNGGSATWTVNGGSETVEIPKGQWVHVKLTGTTGQTAAHLTIANANNTLLYDKDIIAADNGTIQGLYILAGRYKGIFQVDNIVVKEQGKDYVDTTAYDTALKRAKQFAAMQEEKPVFTDASYQALKKAIEDAEKAVTPDKLTSEHKAEIDAQAAALNKAIDGLERLFYTVTVEKTEGGSVTGLSPEGKYYAGDSISLTAKADPGYKFDSWEVNGRKAGTGTAYSSMADGNITVKALFTKLTNLVQSIEIADQTLYMGYGESGELTVGQSVTPEIIITPDTAEGKDVIFETEDSDIIKIEGNKITALKAGTATVTATSAANPEAKKTFTVTVKYEFGKMTSGFTAAAFRSAGSGFEKVTGNFNITYSFDTVSTGTTQWDNFLLDFVDGKGKIRTYRADNFVVEDAGIGWGNVQWTGGAEDWAVFEQDMQNGAAVTVNAVRSGNKLTVTYNIAKKEGSRNAYTMTAASTATEDIPDTLYVRISGENCVCSNLKIASAVTLPRQVEVEPGKTAEVAFNDVVPVDTTVAEAASGDTSVATVKVAEDKKKIAVTGVKAGTAVITVKASNNMEVDCEVIVKGDIAVTGIELSETELALEEGESKTITAAVKPDNASQKDVIWTSSDETVATVDNGKVTAVKAGTAVITAASKADESIKAECAVTVKEQDKETGGTGGASGSGGSGTSSGSGSSNGTQNNNKDNAQNNNQGNAQDDNQDDTQGNNPDDAQNPDQDKDNNTVIETQEDGTVTTTVTGTKPDGTKTEKKEVKTTDDTTLVIETETKPDGTYTANSVIRTGTSGSSGTVEISESILKAVAEDGRVDSVVVQITETTVNSSEKKSKNTVVNVKISPVEGVSIEKVVLTKESITAAKNSGKGLKVNVTNGLTGSEADGYTVTIPAKQLARISGDVEEINITVSVENVTEVSDTSKKSDITKLVTKSKGKKAKTCVVEVAENTDVKAGMNLKVPVREKTGSSNQVYIYKYDKKTGKLVETANSKQKVAGDGTVSIAAAEGTDYVVSAKKLSGKNVETIKDGISVSVSKKTAKAGKKISVKVSLPETVSKKEKFGTEKAKITYKSNNSKIASVSKSGKITAKKKGTVVIKTVIKLSSGQKVVRKQKIIVK